MISAEEMKKLTSKDILEKISEDEIKEEFQNLLKHIESLAKASALKGNRSVRITIDYKYIKNIEAIHKELITLGYYFNELVEYKSTDFTICW